MNPGIRSLEHELLSYDQDVIAAQKAGGPSFTVGLNYTFIGQREGYTGSDNGRDAFLPTIGVKIPLYRKNYDAMVKEKEISKESVKLKKEDKTNALQTGLERGFRDYNDGVRRIALYIELSDHARQAMDILIAEYTSANTNFEEIIRMDRKLLKYKLELEKARADQNTAVAYINYLMGK
jgi:outer membrane protein TolC